MTKKWKKRLRKTFTIIGICIVSIFAIAWGMGFFDSNEIPTYDFSGYVFADGEALGGATVSCGVAKTETDENGYYEFKGLTSVVEVTVEKDNHIFAKNLVYVNEAKTEVNFSGYEKYSVAGVVKNGDQVVAGAKIEVTSQMGVYTTYSNAFGEYSLPAIAGEAKIEAFHDDFQLFAQNVSKSRKNDKVIIDCRTSVTGKINVDDTNTESYDFELKLNDKTIQLNNDLTYNIDNVQVGDKLTLTSQNYYIDKQIQNINVQDGSFDFNAQKYYNLTGYAKSGNTVLENVKIIVGLTQTTTNSDGYFEMQNLYGKNIVQAKLNPFVFETFESSKDNSVLEFLGTFILKGTVKTDNNQNGDITLQLNQSTTQTNNKGEFEFSGARLGDIVSVTDANYHTENNNVVIAGTQKVRFNLSKIYSLSISVECNSQAVSQALVKLQGKDQDYETTEQGTLTIDGLYGAQTFTVNASGYKFDEAYTCDYANYNIQITPQKYFNLIGVVKSADNLIENATVTVGETSVQTNQSGEFVIENLYQDGIATITAQGFKSQQKEFSLDSNELDINLAYDINGKIICGEVGVDGVVVKYNDTQTVTDYQGNFSITDLHGTVELSFEKQYYSFQNVQVLGSRSLTVETTYSISGKVFNSQGNIEGMDVLLVDSNAQTQTCTTDENGDYYFTGLSGEYLLMYDTQANINLLPNGYTVTTGGVYNFADFGYKISGRVMSGDIPVAGVLVKAGDTTVTTNNRGYYRFDLIIQDETLVLSKEGYTFENNNLPIDSSFDGREDVNFECSYALVGTVYSGTTPLENVTVTAGDKTATTNANGEYELMGIKGQVDLSATIEGYYIQGITAITEYAQNNLVAKFDSELTVKTGDLAVADVQVCVNETNISTNEQGKVQLTGLQLGDTVTFQKQGYQIAEYTFVQNQDKVEINCTYTVNGIVKITTQALEGVLVKCGEAEVTTNANGEFEFNGLAGEQTITYEKQNYNFDTTTVNKYQTLTIQAMYSVTGYITVTGTALQDVKVVAGENIAYTDENGYFEIKNISAQETLVIEKQGYQFTQEYTVNGPTELNISAQYTISGYVKSGQITLQGATVMLSNGTSVTTNSSGYYCIEGIGEVVSVTATKTGYDAQIIENVQNYNNNLNFDLTYTVTLNISGISGLKGISVKVGEDTQSHDTMQIVYNNLKGEQLITISKTGYNFSPSQVKTTQNQTISITVAKEYVVSGTITTTSGKPVANAVVQINDKTTITNTSGYYSIGGLVGTVRPKLVLDVIDTAYKGENYIYSINLGQCTTDTTLNYSTVNEFNYAFYLFKKGYQNLNNAKSYQIFGGGTVNDSASGEDQYVNIVYKKDSKNRRLIQDLNWHDGKIMGIVDPRVSQLTYIDMNSKTVQFQTIKEAAVGKDASTTEYTTNWSTTTYQDYLDNYGVNAEGYYPYVITTSTINQSAALNFAYDATNQIYTFEFNLNCDEAMYKYYVIKMSKMCSSQTFKSFSNSKLTYKIGADGFIRQMDIHEVYEVKASIVTSTVTDNFTYVFKTTALNEVIPDINVSSLENIRTSLSEQTATTVALSSVAEPVVTSEFFNKRRTY